MNYEDELISKIAWLYYIDKLKQQTIADRLGISRMRVVRMIDKAQQQNIIQFKIRRDLQTKISIEQDLIKKYKLQDAMVVPTSTSTKIEDINTNVATAASMYLDDRLDDINILNIGYGDTPIKTINKLTNLSDKVINFVTLTGGVSLYLLDQYTLMKNVNFYLIPAPLIASTNEMVRALKKEKSVIEISKMNSNASYTIVGIGGMNDEATIINNGIINKNEFNLLKMKGSVGDILSHFLDTDGNIISCDLYENLISISMNEFKKLQKVIGVAAGKAKRDAIRAALRGGYIDILITDQDTAEWLNLNV
ncbi:MAG: hypothetical protein OWP43_01895 [Sphaerochaetaceae bacterium]|nr:hypothetical protein [Sphaerochaetaceae bacterium]